MEHKWPTRVKREWVGIPCECGGYMDQVDATPDEKKKFGCGRFDCCSRAFVCRLCGKRHAVSAESPEME